MAEDIESPYISASNPAEPQNVETNPQAARTSSYFPTIDQRARTAVSTETAVTPMTFGVEIEFIAFYAVVEDSDDEEALRNRHLGVFLIPDHVEDKETAAMREAILWLRHNGVDINNFDADTGDPELDPNANSIAPHSGNSRNPIYHRWSLQWDGSVYFDHNDRVEHRLTALNFELVSPAMKNDLASYQEIKRVVSLLDQWKIHLPSTAGLHVHVGNGADDMDFKMLRSIAILLWAVDAIMNPIHPHHRHDNSWCRRNRYGSKLACGETIATSSRLWPPPEDKLIGIDQGFAELTKCTSAADVANLMACPCDNGPAYSFGNYDPFKWNDLGYSDDIHTGRKPTIEFRQAAASINPDWLVHWSYICVRMCEYAARELPNDMEFYMYKLIVGCQTIEDDDETYEELLDIFLKRIGCEAALNFIRSTTLEQRASG